MGEQKRKKAILLLIVFTTPICAQGEEGSGKKFCTDSDGKEIPHGTAFIPNYDEPCQNCICYDGYTTRCKMAACSPPPDCPDRKAVPRQCCQFECGVNNSHPPSILHNTTLNDIATAEEDNITNLSLRLVASTVTSFLVLALLLFMVHRLRQRRLMLAMRRFEAQARQHRGDDEEGDHYIPAAFLHIECPPYEDPPPPYSPPKPPHILPADSPPPYEELENDTTSDLDANANVSNNNNNNDRSCQQHGHLPAVGSVGGRGQQPSSNQEAAEAQNTVGEGSSLDSSSQGGKSSTASSQGREEEAERRLTSRRQSHPYDRNGAAFPQDCPLFTNRGVRCSAGEQSGGTIMEPGGAELATDPAARHRHSECQGVGRGGGGGGGVGGKRGGGGRGTRKTGRSCSFSLSRGAEEDETLTGIALGPMSQSYHAATAAATIDSGVQTNGSYTASLSRHKGRSGGGGGVGGGVGDRRRTGEEGGGDGADRGEGEQRMVTKPMAKCDAAVQHSHRLLQEELRRHLPRAAEEGSPPLPLPSSAASAPLAGSRVFSPESSIASAAPSSGPGPADSVTHNRGGGGVGGGVGGHRDRRSAPPGANDGTLRGEDCGRAHREPVSASSHRRVGGGEGREAGAISTAPVGVRSEVHPPTDAAEPGATREEGKSWSKPALPRSQSVTSTFSVCSETGEVHVKKAAGLTAADTSVLHNDCQYPPDHGAPTTTTRYPPPHTPPPPPPPPPHLSPHHHPPGVVDHHPTSLPNYVFPSHTSSSSLPPPPPPPLASTVSALPCGGRCPSEQVSKVKMSVTTPSSQSRRPVPSPPSQELRPASVPSVHRSQSAKPKHKKIHFVPLEKSKTFRSKKEKSKGSKKGEAAADPGHHRHDNRTNTTCGTPQVGASPPEESDQGARGHQPRLGVEVVRVGRVPASSVPSVKQYGFLDLCPPPAAAVAAGFVQQPEAYTDGARKMGGGREWHCDGGGDGGAPPLTSSPAQHHTLPHKSHTVHSSAPSHHPSAHRAHVTHGEKPSARPKSKAPRPLSNGLVVEAGRDPCDQSRRRAKTLHLKKSRQSYPALEGALERGERKATCVDLGFVEPGPECGGPGGVVCVVRGGDMAPFTLPPKRRSTALVDRTCDKVPAGPDPSELLEGRLSYV